MKYCKYCSVLFILGIMRASVCTASIRISEVFRDGTDEWIEVYNDGADGFSGSLQLVGAKGGSLLIPDIVLEAGGRVVIGDKLEMIDPTVQCQLLKDKGLSLSDTAGFTITLTAGDTTEQFIVTVEQCSVYNNLNVSMYRNANNEVVATETATGVLPGFTATPCSIETVGTTGTDSIQTGSVLSGDEVADPVFTGDGSISGDNIGTGNDNSQLTGNNDVGPVLDTGADTQTDMIGLQRGDVTIEEVYPLDNDLFGEYIVIRANTSIAKKLLIAGLGQGGEEKIIDVLLGTGEVLYVIDRPFSGQDLVTTYMLPSLTLTDGGETLTIRLENNTVLDSVSYSKPKGSYSMSVSEVEEYHRKFDIETTPSLQHYLPFTSRCEPVFSFTQTLSGGIVLEAELTELGEEYCTGLYHTQRSMGTGAYEGCTFRTELMSGSQLLSVDILRNETVVCSETVHLYIPDIGGYCERSSDIDFTGGTFRVSEIHATSDYLPEYIELYFEKAYSGTIAIVGLGRGTATKEIGLQTVDREYVVISSSTLPVSAKTYLLPGISLTDGGETITVLGHDGQVIDSIVYTAALQGFSLYESSVSGTVLLFEKAGLPSPGFGEAVAEFYGSMPIGTAAYTCDIHLQHTKPVVHGTKVNVIAVANGKEIQNSSSEYTCERTSEPAGYYGTGCNPSAVTLESPGMYDISLIVTNKANQICTSSYFLNYPGTKGGSESGDLPNSAAYYYELYLKRKDRFERVKKTIKPFGLSLTTSGEVYNPQTQQPGSTLSGSGNDESIFTGNLQIRAVLPNPAGKDEGTEKIILYNTSLEDIATDTLVVFNGKTKKKLPPGSILKAGEETTIEGTLGLGNQPGCIVLQDDTTQYDRFCYLTAGDNQWFTTSYDLLADADMSQFKNTSLQRQGEEFCMLFMSYPIACKTLGYTADLVKQRKKEAKQYLSSQKKLTKALTDLQKSKDKSKELQQKNKEQKTENATKLKAVKEDVTKSKKLVSMYKAFIRNVRDVLYPTNDDEAITELTNTAVQLAGLIEDGQTTSSTVFEIPNDDLEARQKAKNYSLPLQYASIEDVRSYLLKETKNYISLISGN